jgi:hypothetical protein
MNWPYPSHHRYLEGQSHRHQRVGVHHREIHLLREILHLEVQTRLVHQVRQEV